MAKGNNQNKSIDSGLIISNIGFNESAAKSKDVIGRVYEYFLGKFASAFVYGRKSIQRLAAKESRTFAALQPKLLSGELRCPAKTL